MPQTNIEVFCRTQTSEHNFIHYLARERWHIFQNTYRLVSLFLVPSLGWMLNPDIQISDLWQISVSATVGCTISLPKPASRAKGPAQPLRSPP